MCGIYISKYILMFIKCFVNFFIVIKERNNELFNRVIKNFLVML